MARSKTKRGKTPQHYVRFQLNQLLGSGGYDFSEGSGEPGGDPRELYGIERTMVETAVFTYGLLASFVLSAASHNQRAQRPNPAIMNYVGFVLLGMSAAAAVLLTGYAVWQLI